MPEAVAYTAYTQTCVIIPAYNPSGELVVLCKELLKKGLSLVIVNDGSANVSVFKAMAGMPLTIVHHPLNLGQGAALETGIRKALQTGKQFFVTFDCDGQHRPDAIGDLLGVLQQEQTDIVFGSRFYNRQYAKLVPPFKKATLRIATIFDGLLTGIWLTDAHNGLRAFTRPVAEKIHFTENRMAHATEILWLTKRYKWKYRECAVRIEYNRHSQHPTRSIEIAIDLFLRKFIS